MSLLGKGAVAIWHDIAPEGIDEFYAWHGHEHMPERIGVPGFLRGRRYVARDARLQFFNLYEAVAPDVLSGPDYRERLDNPTPRTLSTMKVFKSVARSICEVAASFGDGQGGLVATWRYDVHPHSLSSHIERLEGDVLPAIARDGNVAGAHLLIADSQASSVATAEVKARGERNQVPGSIVVVEGWGDEPTFAELCRQHISSKLFQSTHLSADSEFGLYQLQAIVDHGDLGVVATER